MSKLTYSVRTNLTFNVTVECLSISQSQSFNSIPTHHYFLFLAAKQQHLVVNRQHNQAPLSLFLYVLITTKY